MDSKKILFVLNSADYFRNYIDSGALKEIIQDCFFLVGSQITDKQVKMLGKNKVFRYEFPKNKSDLHSHLFNINTKKYINRSKTFKFRFIRISSNRMRQIYSLLAMPVIYQIAKLAILSFSFDKQLENLIKKINPNLIVIPSSSYEGESFEIIKIANKYGIKTLMLIDNWDNLCSKTVLTRKPDYMTVWGEQTKEHAQRIQKMDKNKVFTLGTPRFIHYFRAQKVKPASPYKFKYALFAGNALAFDEISALKTMDKLVDKYAKDLTIIYRPHPWRHPRKCADTFFEYEYKHVKLDNDAKKYYKKELGDSYAPNLSYYPKLLANMQFMISPLSTMLIEGLLFDKKVFVLTYDDGLHFTSPKNAYRYYEHFKGINQLNGISIIDQINKLSTIFKNKNEPISPDLKIDLDYFITNDTKYYPEKLKKSVEKILKDYYVEN